MKKFWNLIILVLVATLVFQLYQAGKLNNIRASMISLMMPTNRNLGPVETTTRIAPAAPVFASDSEAAEAKPAATPESAQPVASTPTEEAASPATPSVVATPTPEQPVDISTLDRRYWPRTVILKKEMNFYITNNKGQLVGQIAAPAGAVVKLVEISGIQLKLEMPTGSDPKLVDAADTDIQERAREIVKAVGPASMESIRAVGSAPASATPASATPASATPASATATPAPTPWVPRLNERPRNPFQKH